MQDEAAPNLLKQQKVLLSADLKNGYVQSEQFLSMRPPDNEQLPKQHSRPPDNEQLPRHCGRPPDNKQSPKHRGRSPDEEHLHEQHSRITKIPEGQP